MKRLSYTAGAITLLLFSATLSAGERGVRRAAYRHAPAPHMRGISSGCSSCFGGDVYYESTCDAGCHAGCEAQCDTHWGSVGCDATECGCGACHSRLLPSLMSGLDCLLSGIYHNPCNVPYPRPRSGPSSCMDIWFGYNSGGCGCNSFEPEMEPWQTEPMKSPRAPKATPTPMPTNPFKDDELQAPPKVPADLGMKRRTPKLQPVKHRQPKYSSEPLAIEPVRVAEVVEVSRPVKPVAAKKVEDLSPASEPVADPAPSPTRATSKVKQVQHETTSRVIPKNPLRDE